MKYVLKGNQYAGRLQVGLLVCLILLVSCQKEKGSLPSPFIRKVMSVTASSALCLAAIDDDGGSEVTSRGIVWATTSCPTLEHNEGMNTDNTEDGYFNISLTGLTPETNYFLRVFATNEAGTEYSEEKTIKTLMEYIFDVDGNRYQVGRIGEQVWMLENLRTSRYADGTEIPYAETSADWAVDMYDKAYCWYENSAEYGEIYGGLYTWAAATNGAAWSNENPSGVQGVCPSGWHIPSEAEWTELENYLADNGYNWDGTTGGGNDKIAKSMADTLYWFSSTDEGVIGNDLSANNASGFAALPGGFRSNTSSFNYLGYMTHFWLSTENEYSDGSGAMSRVLKANRPSVLRNDNWKTYGYSVRCLMD